MIEKESDLVQYQGNCHCQALQFEVMAPQNLVVWKCNCSVCIMKQNHHFIVPQSDMKILKGQDNLSTYTFNTHQAQHKFCQTCGVQAFYIPRSNPDGYAITIYCIDTSVATSVQFTQFDGQNWEKFYENSGIDKFSKKPE